MLDEENWRGTYKLNIVLAAKEHHRQDPYTALCMLELSLNTTMLNSISAVG